ncbi:MAG: hypothetical protein IJU13_04505 [Bacteroidales bacterium]|nr:hypothetical protein [Bacteroidales bacterium]
MNLKPLKLPYVPPAVDMIYSGMTDAVLDNTDVDRGTDLDDMGETDYEWEL